MSADVELKLRKATFTKGRMRGGVCGQTVEASMRSTFHEVSAWDLEEAADTIEALRAERDAAVQRAEAALTICDGCGSTMTDAELASERDKRPELRSCCPERMMRPITREDWNRVRDEWAADLVRLGRRHREVQAALTEANARAAVAWEAGRELCNAVGTVGASRDTWHAIERFRALRRDAGETR